MSFIDERVCHLSEWPELNVKGFLICLQELGTMKYNT